MNFSKQRRQKYLTEKYYVELEDGYRYGFELALEALASTEPMAPTAPSAFRWDLASETLELLLLNYTAGRSIEGLREQLPEVIQRFDEFIQNQVSPRDMVPPSNEADTLEISQIDAYVYVFWLLALCKLLGHDKYLPKVMEWVDRTREDNRGRDGLFEAVVLRLTGKNVQAPQVLLHPEPYRPLASATVRAPEERPGLVTTFVENWYKGMKDTYWHGAHVDGRYFGYWCLEAALVTVLWDIDDSSYRDNLVYPKDLVDFARQQQAASRTDETDKPHISRQTGERCPHSGRWGVLESPGAFAQERMFKEGDVFPSAVGRDGKEGPVTWIVLMREDGGPTRVE